MRRFQVNTLDSYLTNKTNRLPSQVDGLQPRTIHTINRHILTECVQIEQKINCNPLKLTTIHSDPSYPITKKRGTYAGARIIWPVWPEYQCKAWPVANARSLDALQKL